MDRWTIKELDALDDYAFAAAILDERRRKVTPYSPLGQKLAKAYAMLMEHSRELNKKDVWVSVCYDCGENKGGFYCQIYSDEDMTEQIDDFCIHKEELEIEPSVEYWIHEYCDAQFYVMNY